jgi:phage terminase large subunit
MLDEFLEATRRWHKEPLAFVWDNFQVEPDPWQVEALGLISRDDVQQLALKACKGPGKTALLAWVIWWFLATRWQSKIGATSITEANIDTNLWPELSKWQARSVFLKTAFTWTSTRVFRTMEPANWFAVKRTWPKSGDTQQQADALAGIHADHVMFVLDESGGIPQAVMVTAQAVLATEGSEAKVIQAGNPTHTTGPLYSACTREREHWHVVTITGDPDDPKRSPRINLEWAKQQIELYGRDNPWVLVNVLGQFPPASINALLGVEEVEAAMRRHLMPPQYQWSQRRLGVDVARFGDDFSSLFPRQGRASFKPRKYNGLDSVELANVIMAAAQNFEPELVFIDDTGIWSKGAIDICSHAGLAVIPVVYHGKSPDPRYKNMRAYMWMSGAKAIKDGAALPYVPELIPELTEPTYVYVNGQFLLEPKEEVKKRLGKSPDLADAWMQTFSLPDMPGKDDPTSRRSRRTVEDDYNPYEEAR